MGFVVFIMTKGQLDGSAVDQGEGLSGFLGTVLESGAVVAVASRFPGRVPSAQHFISTSESETRES